MKKFEKPVFVTKSFLPPLNEYVEQISQIWDTHMLTNKAKLHNELEDELKIKLNTENLFLYANGHLALDIAIKSLCLSGEVITTPFTFVSTTNAIVMNGLVPVFCDIFEDNYTIDSSKIVDLITDNTSAIVATHVYGIPCDVYKIESIAKKYGLKVVYDAAHAFGITLDEKPIASFGDISMFSFHATKVFNTIEGGALAFQDKKLEKPLANLRNFGITGQESCELIGINAKMNEFQAAMGLLNLKYINDCILKRRYIAEKYCELLKDVKGIKLPNVPSNIKYNYSYFPILIEQDFSMTRDDLFNKLAEYNVYARKYFYPLVTKFEAYCGAYQCETPVAERIASRILCLPIDSYLNDEEIENIADIIKNIHLA